MTATEAKDVLARLKNGERVRITTGERTGTMVCRAWESCVFFFGLIPDGKTKPYDGYRMKSNADMIDWLCNLELAA